MTLLPATQLLRLGTRGSALALEQTRRIAARLAAADPSIRTEAHVIRTRGDRDPDTPLPQMGEKGVFTDELERALLAGEIDAAVHSLKDLPVVAPQPGIQLAAVCCREDARDALVARHGARLASLPEGAVVGTSSTRRTAQLLAVRPDLKPLPVRGNVQTRCSRVQDGDYDAVVLAYAGLLRSGMESLITDVLPLETFLPAPGQGALAVQCRSDDESALAALARIDEVTVRACTDAERSFLAELGGGCSLPVAALAEVDPDGRIRMRGLVVAADGSKRVSVGGAGRLADAAVLGREMAAVAVQQGALELLQ
jgi:hydroxymethylbilane synthase